MPRSPYPTIKTGEDGYFHAWVTVGTKPNGRPDQRHVKRATHDQVVERVDELLSQRRAAAVVKAGRAVTVQSWLETYLADVAPRKCRPSTLYDYRSKCRNWIFPHLGKTRLDRLTPAQLDALYLAMERAGKASSHQLKVHRILARALEIALRRGLVARNVAKLIDPPSGKSPKMNHLTEAEALQVLAAAEGTRNGARWSVALALGLRQGEALGLRWAQVDLVAGELHIPKQLRRRIYEHGCGAESPSGWPCGRKRGADCPDRGPGGLQIVDPKSGDRTVPIPKPLCARLRAHRKAQIAERLAAADWWEEGDFVFAQPNGRPIDPRRDHADWVALLQAAGVRHVRLHDARHTAGTLLRAHGTKLEDIADILGHTDVRTTRGYAHAVTELMRDGTDGVGRALFGEG
jgi:integrase